NTADELGLEGLQGLPGEQLLYEHVHLNFEGNYRVARKVANKILELLPEEAARRVDPSRAWLSASECAQRLAWTDWERYQALKSVMLRINGAPFVSQMDHSERYRRIQQQMEELGPHLTTSALRVVAEQHRQALGFSGDDWVLQRS